MRNNLWKRLLRAFLVVMVAVFAYAASPVTASEVQAAKNGFVKKGSNTYFYKNGKKQTGWITYQGEQYYFFPGSKKMATGWVKNTKGQKRYFNKKTGAMYTGFKKIGKKTYYFYTGNGIMATGWMKNAAGQKRYFGKNGVMRTGLKTINKKKYYFDTSNGIMCTGFKTVKNKTYYFGSNGVMYVNKTATINGTKYSFDANGGYKVISKPKDVKITDAQLDILVNIIGAVESGGQVYGNQDYAAYTEAYANSSIEHSITIGAFQAYGVNAKNLLLEILEVYPDAFRKYDTAKIEKDLKKYSFVDDYRKKETSKKAKAIKKIISSPEGIAIQNIRIKRLLKEYIEFAKKQGVTDIDALFMCANWIHQGGQGACTRLLEKCGEPYTLDRLYAACQTDTGNQVGAYKTRQAKVYNWLKEKL